MNIVLLSGGSGTRLWPLSNDVRSKQFLQFFKTADGHESMAQRMFRMIKKTNSNTEMPSLLQEIKKDIFKIKLVAMSSLWLIKIHI